MVLERNFVVVRSSFRDILFLVGTYMREVLFVVVGTYL